MRKSKYILTLFILFMLLLLGFSISSIYAWLTDDKTSEHNGETSGLLIDYIIWFEQDGQVGYNPNIDIDASEYFKGESYNNLKVIEMSAGNKNSINYIGNLRFQLNVTTNSDYYIRVKFKNEWFMERTSLSTNLTRYSTLNQSANSLMPYGISSNWYYDSKSNYIYFKNIVKTDSLIEVINSISNSEYVDFSNSTSITKYLVYLDFELEFVQANRMYAIWGMDAIPGL